MRSYGEHEDCSASEPCAVGKPESCPHREARERRARGEDGAWSPLVLGNDGGGRRHFLDGQPVHCGEFLELQAFEYKSDDYGGYTVRLQAGTCVRYEASLFLPEPKVMLYASVGGHSFTAELSAWMRFRWPVRS